MTAEPMKSLRELLTELAERVTRLESAPQASAPTAAPKVITRTRIRKPDQRCLDAIAVVTADWMAAKRAGTMSEFWTDVRKLEPDLPVMSGALAQAVRLVLRENMVGIQAKWAASNG